jgi:hypothetical protein
VGRKAYRVSRKTAGLPKYHEIFGPGFFIYTSFKFVDENICVLVPDRHRSLREEVFYKLYGKRSWDNGVKRAISFNHINKKEVL